MQFGHYYPEEHLFVRQTDTVIKSDLESLVALGHELANEWIVPDEEHYLMEFTFAIVVPNLTERAE